MRFWLILLLIFLSFGNPAKAGFFDDLFGNNNTDSKDKGPFYIKVSDELGNSNTISHNSREIKIRFFYLRQYFSRIDNESKSDLEDAFNKALTVRTQLEKDGPKEKLGQGLTFSIKNRKDDNPDNNYDEIVFESSSIIIDEPQKLTFTFNNKDFADELNINSSGFTKDESVKSISYIPIVIELTNTSLEKNTDLLKSEEDAFSPQNIIQSFQTEYDLDLDDQSLGFELYKSGKLVKALAKKAGKKYRLNIESADEDNPALSSNGSGSYSVRIPITIKPNNLKQLKLFQKNKKYSVRVPAQIELVTSTGLEVKVKILAKAKLSE